VLKEKELLTMTCPKCGAVLAPNEKFCPKCGLPVAAPAPTPAPQYAPPPQPQYASAPQYAGPKLHRFISPAVIWYIGIAIAGCILLAGIIYISSFDKLKGSELLRMFLNYFADAAKPFLFFTVLAEWLHHLQKKS
jgi:hypothetical protein